MACYRPPHPENESSFFTALENRVLIADKSKDTVIVGDLNYNLSHDGEVGEVENHKLKSFMCTHGFINNIIDGTRYNKSKDHYTLLDVMLSYNHIKTKFSKTFDCDFSDHSFVISALEHKTSNNNIEYRSTKCLNAETLLKIKTTLLSILATLSFSLNTNVNCRWNAIRDIIMSIIDFEAPSKKVMIKPASKVPWMDKELVCLSKQRSRIYHRAKKKKEKKDWDLYKILRNKFTSLFKFKKSTYYISSINDLSTSSKKLWNKLSSYINPNKKSQISPSLILKSTSSNSSAELSNVFSNYFSSILDNFNFINLNTCLIYIDNHFNSFISFSFISKVRLWQN